MRRNAWTSNAITEMMDQPKHLREVRENALAILARDGALGELEAAGMVPGSLVLFADFANGQDDAQLMGLIRGPVKLSYFGGGWSACWSSCPCVWLFLLRTPLFFFS